MNWGIVSQLLILILFWAGTYWVGMNKILKIFFPKAHIIIVRRINKMSNKINFCSWNKAWKTKNSLIKIPEGGIAIIDKKANKRNIAPVLLYLKYFPIILVFLVL